MREHASSRARDAEGVAGLVLAAASPAAAATSRPVRRPAGRAAAVDAYMTALAGRDFASACARLSEAQRGDGDCAPEAGLSDAPVGDPRPAQIAQKDPVTSASSPRRPLRPARPPRAVRRRLRRFAALASRREPSPTRPAAPRRWAGRPACPQPRLVEPYGGRHATACRTARDELDERPRPGHREGDEAAPPPRRPPGPAGARRRGRGGGRCCGSRRSAASSSSAPSSPRP